MNRYFADGSGTEMEDARGEPPFDAEADDDRCTYKDALNIATAERDRIDSYMRSVNHKAYRIEPSLRVRRAQLSQAISALGELVKTLGTH